MKCEWKEVKLQDIALELSDGLHKAPIFYPDGEYIFVNATNIENGRIVEKDPSKKTNFEEFLKYGVELTDRTILYSIDGTIGNIAKYRGEKCLLGKGACYITLDDNVDMDYIYYLLQSPIFNEYIHIMSTGSTIKHISLKTMRNFTFQLPPTVQQKAIGGILRLIDDKIELNNKINENLERQAQALYKMMFVDNPHSESIQGVLSDIATITMGQSPTGSSYNEAGNGEVFYQGRAEFGIRFPTRRLFTTEPKRMAALNDVLLSVRAPVGDLNVAYEKCCIGRGLSAIHSKDGNSSFLLYTMFSLRPQLNIFNGEGTVFGSINRETLNSMPVSIPPNESITKFEIIVRPMDDLIRANYNENCRLQAIRDSLLPKLMSGQLSVL